ncbi:Receptor kinase [Rhynchospora pubera]|uniref:Receptor kinase n=1 Tax=Rhynchospora pubera TaxID=906938 RepID=A0AAV8F2D7_9POAL|nr:Receptor kinase [Rhynchospora pubera]
MVTQALYCLLQYILLFCTLFAKAGDVDLLISFKNSLPYPNILSDWNRTNAMCEFHGITCKSGHVSSLTIRGLPLRADFMNSVSAYILPLPNLETLTLHSTNLTGSISGPVNCTVRLKELDISGNNIEGSVSSAASLADSCPFLQSLNLSDNSIGNAFDSFSPILRHLKMLDLSYNNITTNKDPEWLFSKVGLLKYLDLSNNNIQGTIPQIVNCTSLQHLDQSNNQLIGTVSSDIKTCTRLVTLSLSNNNFFGEIPILALLAMPRLEHLDLAFNNFNGSLPKSFSKLTSLEVLDLSANKISGQIPHSLCTDGVSSLKLLYLQLQDNFLTGHIPISLSNCTNLVSLDLSFNLFFGSIPDSLGALSNLQYLIMWQNNLNGEIPGKLSSLRSLRNLNLEYNNLTGTIPDGLVNCTSLNWISLGSNQLTGSIPIWISQLENLVVLILGNNSFTGLIPAELGNCKGLVYLELSSNQLNGSIPSALAKQSGKIVVDLLVDGWPVVILGDSYNPQCHKLTIRLSL